MTLKRESPEKDSKLAFLGNRARRTASRFLSAALLTASLLTPSAALAERLVMSPGAVSSGVGVTYTGAKKSENVFRLFSKLSDRFNLTDYLELGVTGGFNLGTKDSANRAMGLEEAELFLRFFRGPFSFKMFLLNSEHALARLAPGAAVCVDAVCIGGRYELAELHGIRQGPHVLFANTSIKIKPVTLVPQVMAQQLPDGRVTGAARVGLSVALVNSVDLEGAFLFASKPEVFAPLRTDATLSARVTF